MYKIKKITFRDHPVLKNLSLDFCNMNGEVVNTIILAGENGIGKSTILNELYKISTHQVTSPQIVEFIKDDTDVFKLKYEFHAINGKDLIYVSDDDQFNDYIGSSNVKAKYPFKGIFSDVDINFHSKKIPSVTSLNLDSNVSSRRSLDDLPNQINQLLIDIQALDDAEFVLEAKKNPNKIVKDINTDRRMSRFTKAFNIMFENLTYSRINNSNNSKEIVFKKDDIDITIDNLSSGEKQIVYRGCFLLKDINATEGAFVFIDEPEISLHPSWQTKILDYYKKMFTNNVGKQLSQLFVVTHSPFIIHNEKRYDDKIIVLNRNNSNNIIVMDKPEYYKCTSPEVVEDAFSLKGFLNSQSIVYLEGQTDELYFTKALEIFNYNVDFKFKWIGHIGKNRQEEFTGQDSLNKAAQFLMGQNVSVKTVFLFDSDTKKSSKGKYNVYIRCVKKYNNSKRMKKGIENALILDSVNDIDKYYEIKNKEGDYGGVSQIKNFLKMEFCKHICSDFDEEQLKKIFKNLKTEIDLLIEIFNKNDLTK